MKKATKIPSAPNMVSIMITKRCNLHCLHCSASPEQFTRADMTTAELLSVIEELAACKVFRITLTGGEPLIHPDFFVFANAVVKHPIRLQINTNATLVTRNVVDNLKRLQRAPLISVSLDGITAKTHDRIRGAGSFVHVQKGIKVLTSAGLNVRPFIVVSKLNYKELPQIIEFAKSLGAKTINVSMPTACGRAMRYEEDMELENSERREILRNILAIKESSPGLLDGPWADLASLYLDIKEDRVKDSGISDGTCKNCGAAWDQVAIGSDGTVSPCEMAFMYHAGNIRDQSFVEIWRNSSVFNTIRESRGMPLAEVPGCEDCSWHHICLGPCPAGGYSKTGIWPAASPGCVREIGDILDNGMNVPAKGEVL